MSSSTYLVVGGTSGMGRSTVEQLRGPDRHLIVAARNEPSDLSGDGVEFQCCDVTGDDVDELDLPDDLDGLAYFPGNIRLRPFERMSVDAFQDDWDINAGGAVRVLQHATDSLKNGSERAGVVLISTVATRTGMPFHASVAATKSAVEGLAISLAAEWAPEVAVNVIAPSITDTPMAEKLLSSDKKRERSVERHPLKDINDPEDIGSLASQLILGDLNMTGEILRVDGGLSTVRTHR